MAALAAQIGAGEPATPLSGLGDAAETLGGR
jgi:hypothetical protein